MGTGTRTRSADGRRTSTTTPDGSTGRRTPPRGCSPRRGVTAPRGRPSSGGSSRGWRPPARRPRARLSPVRIAADKRDRRLEYPFPQCPANIRRSLTADREALDGELDHVPGCRDEPVQRVPGEDRPRADEARVEARVGQLGLRVGLGHEVAAEREQRRVLAEHREGPQGPPSAEGRLLLPHLREGQGDRLGPLALTPPQPPAPGGCPPPPLFFDARERARPRIVPGGGMGPR